MTNLKYGQMVETKPNTVGPYIGIVLYPDINSNCAMIQTKTGEHHTIARDYLQSSDVKPFKIKRPRAGMMITIPKRTPKIILEGNKGWFMIKKVLENGIILLDTFNQKNHRISISFFKIAKA